MRSLRCSPFLHSLGGTTLGLAVVLFGSGGAGAQEATAPPAAEDRQQPMSLDKEVLVNVKIDYLLYLPKDYEANPDTEYPLVLFLHGAGESGNDLNKVKLHGPPKLVAAGKEFPFILVSPQSATMGWRPETLLALLDDVEHKYRVDPDRVYVTGLSMGGYGTWALAAAAPRRFAAIAPICGGGRPADAERIKDIPVWAFHGAKDSVVPVARSQAMVDALKAVGAREIKFTIYPEADHDSWTETYENPELYEWLLSHDRNKERGSQ